ncbi:MAG: RecQ family ATP-dependent DNA helicase, partial [Candidatus Hydrogenedentes bacterium]|nr:RecQ family ATP-dependent DNA helicase [Candidatus Hydrogenedentota bacterium]
AAGHPGGAAVLDTLKRYWGFDALRPLQEDAIACAFTARDSVVVLPTGGGKSLCFQLPAVIRPGMAVVVSPLISLMKDQVDALNANGVAAACIHSGMLLHEKQAVDRAVRGGEVKLLYVAPERLVQPVFIDYVRGAGVSFIAIDEAHCISHWGHDFRPEYRQLRVLRDAFPGASIHAFTATATPQVRDDIVSELALRDPMIVVGSFDRPNLVYRVAPRESLIDQVRAAIDEHRGESGLVYCISRKNVDDLCAQLRRLGHNALPYHAGMNDEDRRRNQEAFSRDEADIIVATVAFGMGIDKSNVRFVIHAGLPKSLEHYQQETGRAGRDGLEADCRLLYSYADFMMWKSIVEKEGGDGAAIALQKLEDMLQFAKRMLCRRRAVLTYFGEHYEAQQCGACDVCLDHGADDRSAAIARAIIDCVWMLGDYAGPKFTAQVLAGSREERVVNGRAAQSSSYGALRGETEQAVRTWIFQLVDQGYLVTSGEYHRLSNGPRLAADPGLAGVRLRAEARSAGRVRAAAKPQPARPSVPLDQELFDRLRVLRRCIAEERRVPPFLVLGDVSLNDMAVRKPVTVEAFRAIHGIGERKALDLGDVFTNAVREFCDAHGIEGLPEAPEAPRRERRPKSERVRKRSSQEIANELFAARHSLEEVAEIMQRAPMTVEGYLATYIESTNIFDP